MRISKYNLEMDIDGLNSLVKETSSNYPQLENVSSPLKIVITFLLWDTLITILPVCFAVRSAVLCLVPVSFVGMLGDLPKKILLLSKERKIWH